MRKLLLVSSLVIFHCTTIAQYDEKDFIKYTVKNGLSDNYITCLNQDEWGYMWIGTEIGLNRFDGYAFKKYFQESKTLPLLSGSIKRLKSFGPQELGICSRGGFQLLNTKDFSIKKFVISDTTALSVYRNKCLDAAAMPGKKIAVTTALGFYVFNAAGKPEFSYDAYKLEDVGQKRILYGRDIFPINDKEYLVYIYDSGLAYYHAEKKVLSEITSDDKNWAAFYPARAKNNFGWICRYQLSPDEFIFIQFGFNNVLYYNRALNKTVISPLGIPSIEFTWESNITMLNDSSFLLNGGYSGFYLYNINRQNGQVTFNSKKFLPGHKIQCLYLDKEQRLWAGTSIGLLQQKLVPPVIKTYSFQSSTTDSLTGGFVCAYRHRDKLYIGRFSRYKGLVIADANTLQAEKQIEFYGKNNKWNEIRSIQMYHPDTLWIGTNAGLLWFDTKTEHYGKLFTEKKHPPGLSEINILAPHGKDGTAWMCSLLGGMLVQYNIALHTYTFYTSKTNPALPFDKVKSITYDAYGDIWIGGHSLTRWNSSDQIFDTLISIYGGPNKYEGDIVAMVADKAGSLWLHNAFNGLLEYRIKEKKFVSYTMKHGLPSDVFYGLSPVINDQIWITGNSQLTGFNTVTKKTSVYDYLDGLPEDKPSGRYLFYDDSTGRLYLFNQDKLAAISLNEQNVFDYSNGLMIEALTVNNEEHFFYPVTGLKLKPDQNNLSLQFGIIDFESGNNNQFAYNLNNAVSWTDLGEQRNITLTGLSPGTYNIGLRATGKSGIQKTKTFSFTILPPFWKTTWFLICLGLLLSAILYLIYRYRIKQVKERADIDKQLSKAEMNALHAQMNPHFIFNSLNSIREMILMNENKEASHFLGKFAHLIRMTLEQSGQSFISLRNTMDYLTRYIEMEQIRNSQFTCRILADEELDVDDTVLPPMLIQPFVENAIWHGVTGKQKDININIDFKKQNNQLVCIIEDNGIGITRSLNEKKNSTEVHHSMGIDNVKNHISLLNEKYQLQSSLHIKDKNDLSGYTGTGTVVSLSIQIENTEA